MREEILRGQLKLGEALSRRLWAGRLGMSLAPVTEAIQRLESEGLVESRPQVGTRVRIPTERDVRDRFVIREALECQSARLFAEKATARQKQGLKTMAERVDVLLCRRFKGDKDPDFLFAVNSYHTEFHMRIAAGSKCEGLYQLIEKNSVLVLNWIYDLVDEQPAPPVRFHRDLAEVLCGDSPDAAESAMRSHVRWGLEETIQAIRKIELAKGRWRLRVLASDNDIETEPVRSGSSNIKAASNKV